MKHLSLALLFLFSLAIAHQSSASESNRASGTKTIEQLIADIEKLVEDNPKFPAVSIAMVDQNGPVWVGAIGQADVENNIPADENTLFRIGSTSKMFVALAVLKLIEEGKLSFDDKVKDLVPEIAFQNQWEETDPVRLVHLLEHTTGWDDLHLVEYAHNDPTPSTLKQGLDFHPHSRVSRWKPGTRMAYCNSGPPVAAYIVEKITGMDYEEYIQQNFFTPMGMSSMTFRYSDDVKKAGATLYTNGKKEDYWHIVMRPSGSINANAVDMAKFLSFYLQRGKVNGIPLISESSLTRMESPQSNPAAAAGHQVGYGLHNYSSVHKQWIYREHNGGVNGGITEFAYLPEAQVGHAIMINSDQGKTFSEISTLIRDYETQHLPKKPTDSSTSSDTDWQSVSGYYYPINPRVEMFRFIDRIAGIQLFAVDGNKLVSRRFFGGEPRTYYPDEGGRFRSEYTGAISLSQVIDPLAGRVLHSGTQVLKPINTVAVYFQLLVLFSWMAVVALTLPYALVWGSRKLLGAEIKGMSLRVRLWPLVSSISMLGLVAMLTIGQQDPFTLLGEPSWVSVGIMLLTLAFFIFALLGTYTAIRAYSEKMNKYNYWFSAIATSSHLMIALYLAWFGVIGLMTWA